MKSSSGSPSLHFQLRSNSSTSNFPAMAYVNRSIRGQDVAFGAAERGVTGSGFLRRRRATRRRTCSAGSLKTGLRSHSGKEKLVYTLASHVVRLLTHRNPPRGSRESCLLTPNVASHACWGWGCPRHRLETGATWGLDAESETISISTPLSQQIAMSKQTASPAPHEILQ